MRGAPGRTAPRPYLRSAVASHSRKQRKDAALRALPLLHRQHEVVVRAGLIGEALAVLADGDDAGLGAVEDDMRVSARTAVPAGMDRHRHPERGVRMIGFQPCSARLGERNAVPAVALEGQRMRRDGADAAAGQHHAAPRGDALAARRPAELRAGDAPALEQQAGGVGREAHLDRPAPQRGVEARDEGVAHDQARAARVAQPVHAVAGEQRRAVTERAPGRQRLDQRRNVVLADHHPAERQEFLARRADAPELRAEKPPVVRHGGQRAPAGHRAGDFLPVVGMPRHQREAQLRAGFEKTQRRSAGIEKSVDHRAVAGQRPQVGTRVRPRVFDAGVARMIVQRDPHGAGRSGGRAADLLAWLRTP